MRVGTINAIIIFSIAVNLSLSTYRLPQKWHQLHSTFGWQRTPECFNNIFIGHKSFLEKNFSIGSLKNFLPAQSIKGDDDEIFCFSFLCQCLKTQHNTNYRQDSF